MHCDSTWKVEENELILRPNGNALLKCMYVQVDGNNDARVEDETFLSCLRENDESHALHKSNETPSYNVHEMNTTPLSRFQPNGDESTDDQRDRGQRKRLRDVFQKAKKKLEDHNNPDVLKDKIALLKWSIKHAVTKEAFDELLLIIQEMCDETQASLGKDSRSIKPRFRKHIQIINMSPGCFAYIGIKETLDLSNCNFYDRKDKTLKLSINVDGLPAFNSGTNEFYPILGQINEGKIFLIGVYFGKAKPHDANEFIRPLVDEICSFYDNVREGDEGQAYIELDDGQNVRQRYEFVFDMIVTDAVAKAWLLSIKAHSGYFSCSKCQIGGTKSENNSKIYFPDEYTAPPRCNEEYLEITWDDLKKVIEGEKCKCAPVVNEEQVNDENVIIHDKYPLAEDDAYDIPCDKAEIKLKPDEARRKFHKRKPELARIPNFDLVMRVVLDPMHLLLCGLMKRILCFYFTFKAKCFVDCKDDKSLHEMSRRMKEIGDLYWPQEFKSGRRPQSMTNYRKWKCTQFRDFLLYFGITTIKGCIRDTYYLQFQTLSACIRFLSMKASPQDASKNLDIVTSIRKVFEALLDSFKSEFGMEFISHNAHNLLHLPNEYLAFGSLDRFSAFVYENFLKTVKKSVHSGYKPLQQVLNVWLARLYCDQFEDLSPKTEESPFKNQIGEVEIEGVAYKSYKYFKGKDFVIRTDTKGDCYGAYSHNEDIRKYVRVTKILQNSEQELFLQVCPFKNVEDVYNLPFKSSFVGVVRALRKETGEESIIKYETANLKKCFAMPSNDNFILAVLLHTM